jgi:hypothetical protein
MSITLLLDDAPVSDTPNECTFELSTLADSWAIVLRRSADIHIVGCDGADVYRLLIHREFRQAETGQLKAVGTVSRGTFPLFNTSVFMGVVWLAYCSSDSFPKGSSNRKASIPAPWMAAWGSPSAHIYECEYSIPPQSGGLPQEVTFTPDPEKIQALVRGDALGSLVPVTKSQLDRDAAQLAQYKEGAAQQEARYFVVSKTQLGTMAIPKEFALVRNTYILDKRGERKSIPLERISGTIDSVERIYELDPIPRPILDVDRFSVADYRFHDPTNGVYFVLYEATNSTWITDTNSPALQASAAEIREKYLRTQTRIKLPRIAFLVLFVLVACSPLTFKRVRHRLAGHIT